MGEPTTNEQILREIQSARQDISTLNVRLFGTPDGSPDEGRLIVAERRINDHAKRLTWLERIGYGGIGIVTFLAGVLEVVKLVRN